MYRINKSVSEGEDQIPISKRYKTFFMSILLSGSRLLGAVKQCVCGARSSKAVCAAATSRMLGAGRVPLRCWELEGNVCCQ
jgi:hypothetical protein